MDTKAAKVEAVPKPTNKTELKRLDINANSFEANGKKYLIHNSLSAERFKKFEELQVVSEFGYDYAGIYAQITKAYDALNKMKVADAGVMLHNLMNGASRGANKQEHPVLLMATLFIFTEDEDLKVWDETRAAEKIADWNAELYDITDFFRLALRLFKGFMSDWRQDIPEFSPEEMEGATLTAETV